MATPNGIKLNKEQIKAIKHEDGPLLIIAGAGTGKTTVITERIKHLIFSKKAKAEEILALTFTEKAAREMEGRVDEVMPYGYTQMWISTFHSFCDRILRAESLHIGIDPNYKLLTESVATQLIRKNIFDFKLNYFLTLGNPDKFIDGMLKHFSRLQDEDIIPSDYIEWVNKKNKKGDRGLSREEKLEIKKWKELSYAYRKYDELKTKEGYLDFGDLISKTLLLFRQRPNILKKYQDKFKYVLIDEFQDTNIAQNELAVLLAGRKKNITVVGDDDQAIYRFRGAAVSNIVQFRKSFKKCAVVTLVKNYRSRQEILDKAYELIQHNNPDRLEVVEKIDKKLVAEKDFSKNGENDFVEFIHTDRVENEADRVADKIIELTSDDKKNLKFSDIAVLVRANNHFEPFGRALQRKGIPFQFLGPGRLFKTPEVLDLISYLKVLDNFEDSVSFLRVLGIDYFEIDGRDLAAIGNYSKKKNISLFEICEEIENLKVKKQTKEKIKKIIKLIHKHLDLIKKESAGQILYYFLENTGLLENLLNPKDERAEVKAKNISKFFDKIKTYETDNEDASVSAVVDWIDLSIELGESPLASNSDWNEVNAVNILTVHSAKGLEFEVVFLVNLVSQRFPSINRSEIIPIPDELVKEILPVGDFHTEEERRLFYVGMTRAKQHLYLTAANYYGEAKREKKISPFVFEALGEEISIKPQDVVTSENQLTFLDFEKDNKLPGGKGGEKLKVDYLSYSQIQTFQICPLHYKLKYILRIPTPPSSAQSFGSSIHKTLDAFYEKHIRGEKVNIKSFFSIYENCWIDEGYRSKKHELKMFNKGKKILKDYYENEFERGEKPLGLETNFKIPLISKKGDRLILGGTIDKILRSKDEGIEIIDYKTGDRTPNQKEVDKDLQLTVYALAACKIKDKPFGQIPEKIKLTLHFLEKGEKISTTRTKKQLEDAEKEIFKVKKEIETSDFFCSNHMFCKNCEYKMMCNSD